MTTQSLYADTRTGIFLGDHWEDADLILMARIKGSDAQNIVQGTLSNVSLKVFDLTLGEQVGATTALVIADVVFDDLQIDEKWTADGTGYNFATTIDGDYFPDGDHDYRIEVLFTPTSGKPFPFVTEVSVRNLMSS